MSLTTRTSPAGTITVNAVAVVAEAAHLHTATAPGVDRLTVSLRGGPIAQPSGSTAEPSPTLGDPVVLTCGSLTWRGRLVRISRSNRRGRRRVTLTAEGPMGAADRAYLPSFARAGVSGVVQIPGGPRFAPGTRSASTGGPGSTYYLEAGGGNWTLAQALASYCAHASLAGLPAITIDSTGADLSRTIPDTPTDGYSVAQALAQVIGPRSGLGWRLIDTGSGWTLRIRPRSSGVALNLATLKADEYEISDDLSAAVAALEGRGDRRVYVLSVLHYPGGSGDLVKDWDSGDETARAAGDLSSPAYRRYRLGLFALPDGSPSVTADLLPGLPVVDNGSTAVEGSQPWRLFVANTASGTVWSEVSATISSQGLTIWIDGISPELYNDPDTDRFSLTLALQARTALTSETTGGSGQGRSLAVLGARYIRCASAALGLSGPSLLNRTTDVRNDSSQLTDAMAAQWSEIGAAQLLASYTITGALSTAVAPGDAVASITIPDGPGTGTITVTRDGQVASVDYHFQGGSVSTQVAIHPQPYDAPVSA